MYVCQREVAGHLGPAEARCLSYPLIVDDPKVIALYLCFVLYITPVGPYPQAHKDHVRCFSLCVY